MSEQSLIDLFVKARMKPLRDKLWENDQITISGLRRLDRELGIDTYGGLNAERDREAGE